MSTSKYIHTLLHTFFAPFFELNILLTMMNTQKKPGIFHIFEKPKITVAAPLSKSKGSARSMRAPEVFEHHRVHDHQRVQSLRTDPGHDEFSSAALVMWLW